MRAAGLTMNDLFLGGKKTAITTPEAAYYYHTANGAVLFKKVRRSGKKFSILQKDGEEWKAGLAGIQRPLPLYRLPELIKAEKAETVYIAEGEKDVETLRTWGLVATCNFDGAGPKKWKRNYNQYFAGRDVVVLADNDSVGLQHAANIVSSLRTITRSVKMLKFRGGDGYDVTDWAQDGHSKEDLLERVRETKSVVENKDLIITANALMKLDLPKPSWIIPGIIPEGLSLLAGKPKIGKSWLALDLGIALASEHGRALGQIAVGGQECLYLALEDNERRLQSRLDVLLQDDEAPEDLIFATRWPRLDEGGLREIEEFLDKYPHTRLIIIDTLQRIRARDNSHKPYEVDYNALLPLQDLVSSHAGLGVMVIHHLRKLASNDPLELVSGTTGLTGAADTILVLTRPRGGVDGELFVSGRDVEEQTLALRWDMQFTQWTLLGQAEEFRGSKQRQEIRRVLQEAGNPLTPTEIADALGKKPATVRKNLFDMSRDNEVYKLERGKYVIGNSGNSSNHGNLSNFGNFPRLTEHRLPKVTNQ